MTGNNTNTPFDEKVKDALKDFEASNATANWSRMESMLDAAPKVHTINKKIIINAAIAIVVVAGGYLIYQAIPKGVSTITTEPEKKIELKQEGTQEQQTQQHDMTPSVSPAETIVSDPVTVATDKQEIKTETTLTSKTITVEKDATKTNKQASVKHTDVLKEEEGYKTQKIFKMGNEPIFGDMLDSSKGIVGSTKEKEEVKKAAKEQTHANTNWNTFLFSPVAPDSIRKNREKTQADSLKQK